MINVHELSNAVYEVHSGTLSLDDFERWLRRESRNMHNAKDDALGAVFAVEGVLSEYRFAELPEELVKVELVNAILPFVSYTAEPCTVSLVVGAIVWEEVVAPARSRTGEFASNANTPTVRDQIAGSNAAWEPTPVAAR